MEQQENEEIEKKWLALISYYIKEGEGREDYFKERLGHEYLNTKQDRKRCKNLDNEECLYIFYIAKGLEFYDAANNKYNRYF